MKSEDELAAQIDELIKNMRGCKIFILLKEIMRVSALVCILREEQFQRWITFLEHTAIPT